MPARRRRGDEGAVIVVFDVLCAAAILPFLMYAPIHRILVRRELNSTATAQQIFDRGMVWRTTQRRAAAIVAAGIAAFSGAVFFVDVGKGTFLSEGYVFVACIALTTVGVCSGIAVAVSSIGVIVDSAKNVAVFPTDGVPRSMFDVLAPKWLLSGLTMRSVSLTEIDGLTRQAGHYLLLHEPFGSHQLEFSSKLKRDNCINTLREGTAAVGNRIRVSW